MKGEKFFPLFCHSTRILSTGCLTSLMQSAVLKTLSENSLCFFHFKIVLTRSVLYNGTIFSQRGNQ